MGIINIMHTNLKRFFKIDEDEKFILVGCIKDGSRLLKPKTDHGYWMQKSTRKKFFKNVVITDFPDGTTNEEDYEWIEF